MHDRFTVSVTCLGCMLHTMMCAVCTSLGCILLGENASISFMTNRMFSSIIHLLIHGHGQSYPKEWFQCVWVFDLLRVSTSVPVARGNEQKTQEARVIVFRRAANAEALATRRGIHGRVKARYTLAHRHYQHVRRHQWWPPRLCCWCGTLVGADGKLGLKNGSPEAVVYWSCLGRQSDRDARRREPLRQQYHFRCNLPPCRGSNKHLLLLYLIFFMKSFFASFFPVYVSFCYCNMFCFLVRKYVKCVGFKSYKRDLGAHVINSKSLPKVVERPDEIYEKHQERVNLVGWSGPGCIFVKNIANRHPDNVEQLITLLEFFRGLVVENL